jgi:hypothetical protein
MGNFGERANGFVVCSVGEKDLGHPEADFFLIVLQLYVLLEVLEAVLDQKVGFVAIARMHTHFFLACQLAADVD